MTLPNDENGTFDNRRFSLKQSSVARHEAEVVNLFQRAIAHGGRLTKVHLSYDLWLGQNRIEDY